MNDMKTMRGHAASSGILLAASLALLLAAGCATVGPDFRKPVASTPSAWRNSAAPSAGTASPAGRAGQGAGTSDNGPALAAWWKTFQDPLLDGLVAKAIENNLSLRQAQSRIRQGRAARIGTAASLRPSASVSGSATRTRTDYRGGGISTRGQFDESLDARWEIDLFGGTRRAVEAADADVAASIESSRDIRVSLVAEVVAAYVQLRTDQARLSSSRETSRLLEETLSLVRLRRESGLSDELALQEATGNLESGRAEQPSLIASIEASMNALAVLTGDGPGTLHSLLAEGGPIPAAASAVSAGVPAELLRRRPDIRKAEAELAAQVARIGVAKAELYPKLALSGTISLSARSLLSPDSAITSLGPGFSWTLFDGGATRSGIAVRDEMAVEALDAWRGTVLSAMREVEDALKAESEERKRLDSLGKAEAAAESAARLARDKYAAGMTDFTTVLDAERSLLSVRDQSIRSRGALATDRARLCKALGGGWDGEDS